MNFKGSKKISVFPAPRIIRSPSIVWLKVTKENTDFVTNNKNIIGIIKSIYVEYCYLNIQLLQEWEAPHEIYYRIQAKSVHIDSENFDSAHHSC